MTDNATVLPESPRSDDGSWGDVVDLSGKGIVESKNTNFMEP